MREGAEQEMATYLKSARWITTGLTLGETRNILST